MEPYSNLSQEIIDGGQVSKQTASVVADMLSGRLDILNLVDKLGAVLTHKDAEVREKGMKFFTKTLQGLPKDYLANGQVKFISKFYTDRLKDNHKVIPAVLEGYLAIIEMTCYDISDCADYFTVLFREVPCQSQVRQDRHNIFLTIQNLMEKNIEYIKTLGPDFVYGFISAMDGERDPRNLLFLFSFLPTFLSNIPLGHLKDEMFDIISCYYPIDFHPSPDDPTAVSRQELADALAPCLCAIPEFGEQCIVLLIEKLDSSLRLAKIDSLKLLTESCKTFKADSYAPFLKTLWASIYREINHKTDDELKMAAHEALSALVKKLSTSANTDQAFENFVKGILISMQTSVAEASTVAQFVKTTRVLLTTANASKESCIIITKSMVPATIAYYGFNTSVKLQIASLDFLADLHAMAKHWQIINETNVEMKEIPQLCLTAISQPSKEYQIAGFKTLKRVIDVLESDLIVPFVEVLIHNVQHSQDNDLLSVSVETVHAIATKFPEMIMDMVVKGKCDLEHLTEEKTALQKRLDLLCNLASIDDFTKIIIDQMLHIIIANDGSAYEVVKSLNDSISNTSLFTEQKVTQIDSDHGLIDSIMTWLLKEISEATSVESLTHGYNLIATTIGSLPAEKQNFIMEKHTQNILDKCKSQEIYFYVLESLYNSLRQDVYSDSFEEILDISFKICLSSQNEGLVSKACGLVAHFLNKADYGTKFNLMYEALKKHLVDCDKDDVTLCPKLITLYGWITKALILRGNDLFSFWLQKITIAISNPDYCHLGANAVKLIMSEHTDHLTIKQHCRVSLLYKQRMFQSFTTLTDSLTFCPAVKEAYLLSWAYVLGKVPKTILNSEVSKIAPLVIDSLEYENSDLLLVAAEILSQFVQTRHADVARSIQTMLPRLVKLTKYVKSMDVRIKSLQCLYDIANCYPTVLLLPYKQDILLDIAPSLDDKKRLVRNMAVRARTRWFLIGSPGEAKEN